MTHLNESPALDEPTQREQICVTEALAEGDRLLRQAVRLAGIALLEVGQRPGDDHEAPFHAVETVILEQSLGAANPSAPACRLAAAEQARCQPEGATHRPGDLAAFEEL